MTVSCHKVISSRARGPFIWFLYRNHWASGPSGYSKLLRNPVLKYFFPLSLSLPSFPQFLRNLTHFTMVSGGYCDEDSLELGGGVAASPLWSLLKWLQSWQHDTSWATVHVGSVHISWAHGGQNQIWGYLLWTPFRLHQDSELVCWGHHRRKWLWGQAAWI